MNHSLFKLRVAVLTARSQTMFNLFTEMSWAIPREYYGKDAGMLPKINTLFNDLHPLIEEVCQAAREKVMEKTYIDSLDKLDESLDFIYVEMEHLASTYVEDIPPREDIVISGYSSDELLEFKPLLDSMATHVRNLESMTLPFEIDEISDQVKHIIVGLNRLSWSLNCMCQTVEQGELPETAEHPGTMDDWKAAYSSLATEINTMFESIEYLSMKQQQTDGEFTPH